MVKKHLISSLFIMSQAAWAPLFCADGDTTSITLPPVASLIEVMQETQKAAEASDSAVLANLNEARDQDQWGQAWLAAATAAWSLKEDYNQRDQFDALVQALQEHLPSPQHWPKLYAEHAEAEKGTAKGNGISGLISGMFSTNSQAQFTFNRDLWLDFVAATLNHEPEHIRKVLPELHKQPLDYQLLNVYQAFLTLNDPIITRSVMKHLSSLEGEQASNLHYLNLPPISQLFEEEEREAVFLDLLRMPLQHLNFQNNKDKEFAAEVLGKHRAQIKTLHWDLVATAEDSTLFLATEAMAAKQPQKNNREWAFNSALAKYIGNLLIQGKTDQAIERLKKLSAEQQISAYSLAHSFREYDQPDKTFTILHNLLQPSDDRIALWQQVPLELSAGIWELYIESATQSGNLESVDATISTNQEKGITIPAETLWDLAFARDDEPLGRSILEKEYALAITFEDGLLKNDDSQEANRLKACKEQYRDLFLAFKRPDDEEKWLSLFYDRN